MAAVAAMAVRPELPAAAGSRAALRTAVREAMTLHRAGRLAEAEAAYRRLLQVLPDEPNLLHFHGVLLYQRHRVDEAVAAVRRSIALDPRVAAWHNNLGNMLLDQRQWSAAAESYRRCLSLEPEHLEVRNNLACLLRMTGQLADAEALLRGLIARAPAFADAQAQLALVLAAQGRVPEALECGARALDMGPEDRPRNYRLLGHLYAQAGLLDEAARIYRAWLAQSPDDAEARHHLAAVTGNDVPERACDDYVVEVFGRFAASFDVRLARLQYAAPELCCRMVEARGGTRPSVLDAGCGTGLCGPLLRPLAGELVGLDLSAAMLERARATGCYDHLVQGELSAWMASAGARFDTIVSADTLCYFGPLQPVLTMARQAAKPGALLVFTVEALEERGEAGDCRLQPHGRYAHARPAVDRWLALAGWHCAEVQPAVLRQEAGRPVAGWVFGAYA